MALSAFLRPHRAAAAKLYPVVFRRSNPYQPLETAIEPGHDEFTGEAAAAQCKAALESMLRGGEIELAPGFTGRSPMPSGYTTIDDGIRTAVFKGAGGDFRAGLRQWLHSLGRIRRAAAYPLPKDRVRFEVASQNADALEYHVGHWEVKMRGSALEGFQPLEETVVRAAKPWMREVTAEVFSGCDSFERQLRRGIPYWRSHLDAAAGTDIYGNQGISVADIDGDGQDEIFICQSGGLPNRLYKFSGGRMTDITRQAGLDLLDDSGCAIFADFRNLGRQDLVLLRSSGPLLYLNDGHGRFTLKPGAFQFANHPQGSFTGAAAADYDRDGKLDIYLCCYSFFESEDQYLYPLPYHDAQNGPPNFLFRNRLTASGGGAFEDVTSQVGLGENNNRFSFAPSWCDYDGDGWPDLYVANDFGRNNLYKNVSGKFRDVAAEAGVEDIGPGMSTAWFDYDRDGREDLYISNMWTANGKRITADPHFKPLEDGKLQAAYHGHTKGNSLYRNRGGGKFDYRGDAEQVEMGHWAWSSDAADFDNDGAAEILIACGMMTNTRADDLEGFFWRQVVARSPVTATPSSAYENGWNAINQFIREEHSWSGRQPNVIYARRGGRYRDVSGVTGLDFSADSRTFAFTDLDGDGRIDVVVKNRLGPQVRVFLNNCGEGNRSIAFDLRGVQSNRDAIGARLTVDGEAKTLRAGSGYLSQHSKRLLFGLGKREKSESVTIVWPSGQTQEFRNLDAGYIYRIEEGAAAPERRPFRASTPPSGASGAVTGDNTVGLADTWLLDPLPLPDPQPGPALLWVDSGASAPKPDGVPVVSVDLAARPPDVAAGYALFRRYLFDLRAEFELPLLLLIDSRGQARKIYAKPPNAAQVRIDIEAMTGEDPLKLGLPFDGAYVLRPRRNQFQFGAAFFWAGYPDLALQYLNEEVRRAPANAVALMAIGQIHLEAGRTAQAREFSEKALQVNPKLAGAWNTLGGVEMAGNHLEAALAGYRKAIEIQPDMKAAVLNAAQVEARLGHTAEAEQLFRRALALDPKDSDAADQYGLLLAGQGRTAEAKTWFEKAIELQRDNASAINNLGVLFMQLGQKQDAIAAFQYGLKAAPDSEMLYFNLAKIYAQSGDLDQARELMRRLLERKPGNETALHALQELDRR
jgi:tetratricopeptide (TPR) repeat protein